MRPVVAERGTEVTTRELAEAAGVAEGTLFRVFADKRTLVREAALAAADPSDSVDELAAIDLDQPLADRLRQVVELTVARVARVMVWMSLVHRTGGPAGPHGHGPEAADVSPEAAAAHQEWVRRQHQAHQAVRDQLVRILEPDAVDLRLPVDEVADLLDALLLGVVVRGEQDRRRGVGSGPLPSAEVVRLFLHGVSGDGTGLPRTDHDGPAGPPPHQPDAPPTPDRKDGAATC